MKRGRFLIFAGRALGVLAILLVGLVIAVWLKSDAVLAQTYEAKPSAFSTGKVELTPAQLADADRQLYTKGCISCHGADLSGHIMADMVDLGDIHTANVTLAAQTMSDAELEAAIRQGIAKDGHGLMVMPSRTYQFLTDTEVAQLIAAIRARPVAGDRQPPISLKPLGRFLATIGELKPMPEELAQYRDNPIPKLGEETSQGRHLVQGICAECHGADLGGLQMGPLAVPALDVAAGYDLDQFKTLLREGVTPAGQELTLMREVATQDFVKYTDEEIASIHAYLNAWAARRN